MASGEKLAVELKADKDAARSMSQATENAIEDVQADAQGRRSTAKKVMAGVEKAAESDPYSINAGDE